MNNVEIRRFTAKQEITWGVFGDLDNAVALNTICEYATTCDLESDHEKRENPYKIARNILTQVGYKLYPLEQFDDNGAEIPTRFSLPYTNEYCHFITHSDMKAVDALYYLLSYAVRRERYEPASVSHTQSSRRQRVHHDA